MKKAPGISSIRWSESKEPLVVQSALRIFCLSGHMRPLGDLLREDLALRIIQLIRYVKYDISDFYVHFIFEMLTSMSGLSGAA